MTPTDEGMQGIRPTAKGVALVTRIREAEASADPVLEVSTPFWASLPITELLRLDPPGPSDAPTAWECKLCSYPLRCESVGSYEAFQDGMDHLKVAHAGVYEVVPL